MLKKKDAGRARFQVLVRKPIRTETDDEMTSRYIVDRGAMAGQILLRMRGAYPIILIHSSLLAHYAFARMV